MPIADDAFKQHAGVGFRVWSPAKIRKLSFVVKRGLEGLYLGDSFFVKASWDNLESSRRPPILCYIPIPPLTKSPDPKP